MGKDKKGLNPADAFRKAERKKELQKGKKVIAEKKAFQELLSNPKKIEEELRALQKQSDENRLDKGLKEKVKEMQSMLNVARMRAEAEGKKDTMSSSSVSSAAASSAAMPRPQSVIPGVWRPELSHYYHPSLNPSGMPPPGVPIHMMSLPMPMYPRPMYGAPPPPPPPMQQKPCTLNYVPLQVVKTVVASTAQIIKQPLSLEKGADKYLIAAN